MSGNINYFGIILFYVVIGLFFYLKCFIVIRKFFGGFSLFKRCLLIYGNILIFDCKIVCIILNLSLYLLFSFFLIILFG